MAKRKHSADWMLDRVKEYLSGKESYHQIAEANGISVRSLCAWAKRYGEQGEYSGHIEPPNPLARATR